jgi:hypothetical protein
MKPKPLANRWFASVLFLPFATFAAPASAPAGVASVAPRVPPAAGKPCVVELFRDSYVNDDPGYAYTPPANCPGPWSKIILKAKVTGARSNAFTDFRIFLEDGTTLLRGLQPRFEAPVSWHLERDVTDYTALFRTPQMILVTARYTGETPSDAFASSARLEFYRATPATPARRAPDLVVGTTFAVTLPHNIERAYLDVDNAQPWWFTCVPRDLQLEYHGFLTLIAPGDEARTGIFQPAQGCTGTASGTMEVAVDGRPAGLVPAFPLLSVDFSPYMPNTVNLPAASPQSLLATPWRVDLTPFAAVLNAPGPHRIQPGTLLLYLDKHRTQVSGAVTRNTLEGSTDAPMVTDTIVAHDDMLKGSITTRDNRSYEIDGFVNTSHGTIRTQVRQASTFSNVRNFRIVGLEEPHVHLYQQNLRLTSHTHQTSRRTQGSRLLARDTIDASYPLTMHYRLAVDVDDVGDAWYVTVTGASASANQRRLLQATHERAGHRLYTSRTDEGFVADAYPRRSAAGQRFSDSRGSCRSALLGTYDGQLVTSLKGVGCPHGRNRVQWFAHPDGSPANLAPLP